MASTAAANQAIFKRLSGMSQFHPATANLFADWTLDPGDVVTVRQGQTDYTVPIYQMNLDWRGKPMVEVQSTGSEKRPPLSALKRNSYGSGKRQEEQEQELIRHRADIETNNERILLWATEEEWSEIAGEYQTTHNSQFEVNAAGISSVVTGIDAGTFKASNAYAVGDVTVHNGKVYVFRTAHAANTPWDPTEVQEALNLYGSVKSHSTRIQQTESKIALVVDDNGIRRGQILLAINGDGGSEALIQADQVQLSGTVTLNDKVSINQSGSLVVSNAGLAVSGSTNPTITIANGRVSALIHQVAQGGYITFVGSGTGEYYNLGTSNVPNLHAAASIANDTLTVSKLSGGSAFTIAKSGNNLVISDGTSSITFNKAVSLSGAWNGSGTYTVSATSGSISGTVPSTTANIQLTGNGSTSFSAELLSDQGVVQSGKSKNGYLHQSGNSVGVYTTYSGGSYSGLIASIQVSGGGAITGMYATPVTGSYYDQTEGYWFGDTTIHYELSGDSTDHTEALVINVQEPINKGVNAGWTQAAQQTVWPSAGSGQSFGVTVADSTWGTTTGKTFSLNASNGTIYVNDGTNNVAQIAAGGSYSFSCTEQAARWTDSISGYLNCGTISKSSVQSNAYLRFRIKCDNAYKYCYITVNP